MTLGRQSSARRPHLPDPFVGLVPDLRDVIDHGLHQRPGVRIGLHPRHPSHPHGVHEFARDVQLELVGGAVAETHGGGPLVAGEPGQLHLRQSPGPVDAVHDLQLVGVAGDGSQQPVAPRPRFVKYPPSTNARMVMDASRNQQYR